MSEVDTDDIGVALPLAPVPVKDRAVVIRVKNARDLVAAKGKAAAEGFEAFPDTFSRMVYERLRNELAAGLKEKGVDADVAVTETPPVGGGPPPADFLKGIAIGASVVGIAWLLRGLLGRKR